MFFRTIGRGFRNIARFSGRDTLSQFWIYAGSVIVLAVAGWMAIFMPAFMGSFARMERFAAEHPDQADVVTGPGSYSISIHGNHPELMPDFGTLMAGMSVIAAVSVVLLAAAVTRRLHDRGKRGYWGLPLLLFLAIGMTLMPGFFSDFAKSGENGPDMRLFGLIFLNNFLYIVSLAILVVQLVQSGTRGANRFGESPLG
ncbi:MAG: DUF805 domain-containing protein [Sphingomonas bacterium]